MRTPWGEGYVSEAFDFGFTSVTTPGHGGLMIAKKFAREHYLSAACLKRAIDTGKHWAFEEDCAWAVAAFELAAYWPRIFQCMPEAASNPIGWLHDFISGSDPDYLHERGIAPNAEREAQYRQMMKDIADWQARNKKMLA